MVMYSLLGTYNQRPNLPVLYFGGNQTAGEFYTRIIKGSIQVKNGRDGEDSWTKESDLLVQDKWLQISFVYKSKIMDVYVNGQLLHTFSLGVIGLSKGARLRIGNAGLKNDYVRELRFWSKALTPTEINDYLYLPVNPEMPNLEMYVPFDKEHGAKDISLNAAISGFDENGSMTFIDNVKFPSETLIIEELENKPE